MVGAFACALAVAGGLALTGPAQAESGAYSGWTHREDARTPGTDTVDSRPGSSLHLYSFDNQVSIVSDASPDGAGSGTGIEFLPPRGKTLQSGVTYPVGGAIREPTSSAGQVITYHDGTMCGRSEDQLATDADSTPEAGWFRVNDIEYVDGAAVSFAATYEINCQYVDGPAGFEGSIAVNSSRPPAPVPDAPPTPGPITDLKAKNTNPDGGGDSTTTLSWTNPANYGDINIDMVQSANASLFPAAIAGRYDQLWRGRAGSYYVGLVEFWDVRTYRLVARSPSGRLGTPSFITVMGSRLDVPVTSRTIMVGQQVSFSGRLSEAISADQPAADPMSGPGLPGRTVVMCQQSTAHYVDGACNRVDSTTTSADGRFTLSATPVANSFYAVMAPSSPDVLGNRSWVLTTGVAPQTDLRLPAEQALGFSASSTSEPRSVTDVSPRASAISSTSSSTGVRRGSILHFTTSRARRGSLGIVRLQHLSGGSWHTVVTKRLGRGIHRLAIPFREYTRGLHSFRVVKPADSHHVNGHSHIVKVRIR